MADQGFSFGFGWTYDVFISFRGEDTRHSFTEHLYRALQGNGIRAFVDDGMLRGEEGSRTLINSIEESRAAIVIFSQNYATSTWCLDELVKIMECVKGKGRLIVPVFYYVDPQDVRYQRGSYGEAFDKHGERFKYCHEKVRRWASALHEAANISGFHLNPGHEFESELIGRIVEVILSKISRPALPVAKYPVGLQSRLLELHSLLNAGSDSNVKMVGIYGIGGIGKTTIAKALYNVIADHFEGLSFLRDVRESSKCGLVKLQERLLSDVLEVEDRNIKLVDVNEGISILKGTLSQKKFLLILDDVSNLEQLQAIAGGCEWFGPGSRIIITTRVRRVLLCHGVGTMFKVKPLNPPEALELFTWNAFRTNAVDPSYMEASKRALLYAKGLPLALEVLGSNLYGKTMHEWESVLGKYGRIAATETPGEILRVSYEDLDLVQKAIFLDIACFFIGHRLEYVSNILQSTHGFTVNNVIGMLVDKSLVRLECGVLQVHDLIREVVLQQSRFGPFKVLRRFPVFKENEWLEDISSNVFKKMTNLKLLARSENLSSLPSLIHPAKFVTRSMASILDKPLKQFEYLSHMDFKSCKFLSKLPDLSGAPNMTELRLDHCKNLTKIHDSLGFLHKLRVLTIKRCAKLNTILQAMELTSLEVLDLSGCSTLQTYSKTSRRMGNLRKDILVGTIVLELPKHEMIRPKYCSEFPCFSMPKGQWGRTVLSSVTHLDVSACNLSDQFLVYLACCPNLKNLNLRANDFTILPACIKECSHLSYLSMDDCKKLQKIEEIPPNIELFRATNCTSLTQTSSSKLLSQELHKAGNTQIILPGSRVPEWFDYFNWGESLTFWVRKKFPHIALCFVLSSFKMQDRKFKLKLCMLINGKFQFEFSYNYFLTLVTEHIMLFDLQSQMANDELDEILLDNVWNLVQVSCVDEPSLTGIISVKEIIRCIGVYLYKPQSGVENIRFANPKPEKRKNNLLCCGTDLELHCNPLLKRQRNTPKEADGCPVTMENCMDHFEFGLNDIAVEATYAFPESEMSILSPIIDSESNTEYVNNKMSAETKQALKFLQDSVSKRFSLLLDPRQFRFMSIILDHLLSLSENDGVSLKMRSAILQVSRSFTQWSRDYAAATVKHELTTAELSKVDKLEADIEAYVKKFKEVDLLEDELHCDLACFEESKRKLEEHILVINEQIKETKMLRKPRR